MRILKPLRIGCMTHIIPGVSQHQLVITGMLCWDLSAPDSLHTEQVLWQTAEAEFAGKCVLDHWMPKQSGEFLVWGKAAAPGKVSVQKMEVEVSVGSLHKRIAVTGDRFWRPSVLRAHMTEPEDFTEMPLVYTRTFGGQTYPANPVGLGHQAQRRVDAGEDVQLPNLEDPRRPILHQDDEPSPLVFSPADLTWPGYMGNAGTFDQAWINERFPLMPNDFNWAVYNVAQQDQQLKKGTYFNGHELVRIAGMHADHPVIETRLPGLQMRMFAMREPINKDAKDTQVNQNYDGLIDIPTCLDTVWLFPSALMGVSLYRGVITCDNADALDINTLMFACERTESPRSMSHYDEVFRLRSDEETKALYAFADDQLMPELTPAVQQELEEKREKVRQERREKWRLEGEHFKELSAALTGVAVPSVAAAYMQSGKGKWLEDQLPVILPEDIARGNVDMAAIQRAGEALKERAALIRPASSRLVPSAMQSEMGFTPEEIAKGAKLTNEQVTDLLALDESHAVFSDQADELDAIIARLENDPSLPVSQEIAAWNKKQQEKDGAAFRDMVRDKKLLKHLEEAEALQNALNQQGPPQKPEPESPELRASLIASLREMSAGFQAPLVPPNVSGSIKPMLQALGVDVDPEVVKKWPPGKLDALVRKNLQTATQTDGMAGMAALAGNLRLASLQVLPPDKSAELLPHVEKMVASNNAELASYKSRFPEADASIRQAFSGDLSNAPADFPKVEDGFEKLRKVAADLEDPVLRARTESFIQQGQEMLVESMAALRPDYVQDGKIDYQRLQQEAMAQTMALANFKLPAQDDLPEDDHLTYDKRYVTALAFGIVSRLGLPLAAEGASAADQIKFPDVKQLLQPLKPTATLTDVSHKVEALMRDGRLRSPVVHPQLSVLELPVSAYLGAWVRKWHAEGKSLAGRDLAGADLRGADLRGADLTGAFLECADLSGAKLDGARCDNLVLSGAQLMGASLRGVSLRGANLGQAKAHGTIFAGADLSEAQLYQADLSGADCSDAVLDKVNGLDCILRGVQADRSRCAEGKFVTSDLSDISFNGAQWYKVMVVKSQMPRFQARAADLDHCAFVQTSMEDGDLQDAKADHAQFNQCDGRGLRAHRLRANRMCWVKSNLQDAQFSQAALKTPLFETIELERANFQNASLAGGVLMRCKMVMADLHQAQLLGASFHNADLTDANLRFANLHRTDFSNTVLDRADLTGTRRIASWLEVPRANSVT